MKSFRKSPVLMILFLGTLLWTTFSYSMQSECFCCYPKEYRCASGEKKDADKLCLSHKNQLEESHHHPKYNPYRPEDNHHHQGKNQSDQGCNHSSCIKCGNSSTKEALFSKVYYTGLDKKQVLILEQNISEEKILLPKGDIVAHLNNTPTLKFLSLFLLNSSFLL